MVKKFENEPKNKESKKTNGDSKEIPTGKTKGLSIVLVRKKQTQIPKGGVKEIKDGSLCDALAAVVNERTKNVNVGYFKKINDNLSQTTTGADHEDFKNIHNTSMNTVENVTFFKGIDDLCREAKSIHISGQMDSYMTVFCVALLDVYGYIKKFAFHNKCEIMTPDCRDKASDLGYNVIQADQSHAEIQFIQFILKRNFDKTRYPYIVGMGCSQRHCRECYSMLRMVFGKDYTDFSAATSSKYTNKIVKDDIKDKCTISVRFEILHEDDTVKPENEPNSTTKNFYLPPLVRRLIGSYLKIKKLTFGPKYDKKKKEEKKEEEKEDKKKENEKKVVAMVCYY